MTHLDTNFLIGALTANSAEYARVSGWIMGGDSMAISAVAWSEFLNGPATPGLVNAANKMLTGGINPFATIEAEVAARLFNSTGRRRALRFDCMIAASAMVAGARLATNNTADFQLFTPHGLQLA